jgi:hypothetical protein
MLICIYLNRQQQRRISVDKIDLHIMSVLHAFADMSRHI